MTVGNAVIEEGGNLVFDVNLTNPYSRDLNLTFTVEDGTTAAGEDYNNTTITVFIPSGDTGAVAVLPTNDDGKVEENETLTISLDGQYTGVFGNINAVGTITDNDTAPSAQSDDFDADTSGAQTIDVLANDSDGSFDLDPSSVRIIDPSSGDEVTHYVVQGQGSWDVNTTTGAITFTPEDGYVGDPTPVQYVVSDTEGNPGNASYISINYPPVANDDIATIQSSDGSVSVNVLGNDEKTSQPLDPASVGLVDPGDDAICSDEDQDGNLDTCRVPGVGLWEVDSSGNITLTPEDGFTGEAEIDYTVAEFRDAGGTQSGGLRSNEATVTIGKRTTSIEANFFNDSNNNGTWDSGEPAVSHAKVELLDKDGNVIATQYTDEDGKYAFRNLPFAHYKVRFTLPEEMQRDGYVFGGDVDPNAVSITVDADTTANPDIILSIHAAIICGCANVESDSIDSMNYWTFLMMLLLVLALASREERTAKQQ